MNRLARAALALSLLPVLAGSARADRLITHDGRILVVQKARKLEDGQYRLQFEHGTILCPSDFVKTVEIEGDMSDYVPANADEQKKLEQGYVRYQGKWMSKSAYQTQLNKEAEARRERVEELAAHSNFFNGWEEETKHFKIKTNTSPELLEHYSNLLEAYYKLMDKRVGIKPTPTLRRTKMRVNIFKNRNDWEKNNEAGVGGGVVGYFDFFNETLNFFHDYSEPSFSDWVGLHECTHLLTYLIEPQSAPAVSSIWVNEGVADFFGSSEVTTDSKGKVKIEPGKLQVDRILTVQQAIKDGDNVRLEDLLLLTKPEFHSFEYAHAWSFVYFLNNSSAQYAKGFKKFFKEFYTAPKGVETSWEPYPNKQGTARVIPREEVRRILLDALKVKDVAQLEREWVDFIKGIEIDGPDARFKRGYRIVRTGNTKQFDQAKEDLDAAIQDGFEDPRAYWARGLVNTVKIPGMQGGLEDFRKAVELAPLNPSYRYTLAQCLAGLGVTTGGLTIRFDKERDLYGSDEQLEEAKQHFGLACEMAPENGDMEEAYEDFMAALRKHRAKSSD